MSEYTANDFEDNKPLNSLNKLYVKLNSVNQTNLLALLNNSKNNISVQDINELIDKLTNPPTGGSRNSNNKEGMKGGKSRKNKLIKSLRVNPKNRKLNKTKRNTTL